MTIAAFAARTVAICVISAIVPLCADAQSFVKHPKWFKVGPNPSDVVAVDLTGDGLPEIVTSDRGRLHDPREEAPGHNQLSFLLATEPLRYVSQPQLRTGFAPYSVAVANIDGTNGPDLVAVSFMATRNNDLTLLRNLGDNLFEPRDYAVVDHEDRYTKIRDGDDNPIFTAPGLTSLVIEDFDQDGFSDVVATGWSADILVVWPGIAESDFGDPLLLAEGGPRDVEAADFDGDGNFDLAVAMYSAGEIAFWKGDGKHGFESATRLSSRGRLPQKIEKGDLDGDGTLDLIVSHCHADDSIVALYGDGGFQFSLSQEWTLGEKRDAVEARITDVVARDLNADGRLDLAAACFESREVVVFLNEGRSEDSRVAFAQQRYAFDDARPRELCVADFNTDEKPDLAVALWEADSVALLLGR